MDEISRFWLEAAAAQLSACRGRQIECFNSLRPIWKHMAASPTDRFVVQKCGDPPSALRCAARMCRAA
jgi:hypothetical protein